LISLVVLRMKKITIAFAIIILSFSCSTSILDKKFAYQFYENHYYKELLVSPEVSESDLFLINYCVIRQRDYFNYTIEDKTFREILEMAKTYQKNGFPVDFKLENNGAQDKIKQEITLEGIGHARKGTSKTVLKTLNFSCKFNNPTNKDVVLLNSSFIINGPFGDHLTTVNYEINCILKANSSVTVPCIVPGKTIQQNILFEGNPLIFRLGIDDILTQLQVVPSGLSYQDQGKYFKECFYNAARIEPHNIMLYSKALKDKDWKVLSPDGTYSLNMGNMHIPDDSDEVIEMR
jgi:hypothetical protein